MRKFALAFMLTLSVAVASPALAQAVGPAGKVYAVETAEVVKIHPEVLGMMNALAAQSPNVIVSDDPVAAALPPGLDAVIIRQNYHDLYDKFMGPADVPAFNKAVFSALKPGGVYVVLDHAAAAGSAVAATDTLHRIDPSVRHHTDQFLFRFRKPK